MSTFTLTIGLVIREGQRSWRLDRALPDGKLVFLDLETGVPKTLAPSELQRELLAKRLAIVQEMPVALGTPALGEIKVVKTIEDLPQEEQKRLWLRLAYVRHMLKLGLRKGMRPQITKTLNQLGKSLPNNKEAKEHKGELLRPPSASTVMAWMRKYEQSGANPLSVLSGYVHRKRRRSTHKLVLEVARHHIRKFYCTRQRPTAATTKLLVDRELEQKAALGLIDAEKAVVSASTLRRLIEEIPKYDRDKARYGAAYANNHWRYSLGGVAARRVLERYEIDHTILDIVVVSDSNGMPLGRPTITVVVDSASGYICSLYISFWGAGLASALSAFKLAIRPKDDITAAANLKHPWLSGGIPDLIVVDNGLEFHSLHFLAAAVHLATDVLYCAVRQPWLKPFVERAIREINGYLPHAGRVEKRLNNYLPLKPEKTACITFGALCAGLLKAVVDVHPFETNERRLERAFDLYSEGLSSQLSPRLASSFDELDIIMATTKNMTVTGEGVVSDYLRFNSVELQSVARSIAHSYRTDIKFNPEDLSHIWVQDPRNKAWLQVPACDVEYTAGLSLVQHKAIRKHKKAELSRRNAAEVLRRGKLELIDMWASSIKHGKRLKTSTLKALSGMTSSHVLAAATAPDSAASRRTPLEVREPLARSEMLNLPKEFETYEFS